MRPAALGLPALLSLTLAACGSGNGAGGPSGFDRVDAARLGYAQSLAPDAGGGTAYRLSPSETVTVERTGPNTTVRSYEYGGGSAAPSARKAGSSSRAPTLANGRVPWFTTTSRGKPKPAALAARDAGGYMSSRYGDGWAVPVSAGDATGRLRIVTVDGHDFGVVAKVDKPFWGSKYSDEQLSSEFVAQVERQSGCFATGPVTGRDYKYGGVERLVIPLKC